MQMSRSILLICLFFLSTTPCYGLEITFRQTADVDAVAITLDDIADFDDGQSEIARALASKTVAQAGQPGQDVDLDAGAIVKQLSKSPELPADLLWSGAPVVRVHRTSVTIGPDKIQEILDGYFASHSDDMPVADTRFIVDGLPLPFVLPTGELKWEVFPSDPNIIGSSRFSLIFSVDGKVKKNMSLRGHFEAMAPVAVAAAQLAKGTLLDESNITMATKDITKFSTPCLDPANLKGKVLVRSIKEGGVIEMSAVQQPPLIRKGEMVKIVYNRGGIFLSTQGVAKTNGTIDEMIKVQNINSKKILNCRVSAAGLVEVAL